MAEFRMMEHEEAPIRAPKTRQKFIADNLYHMGDLDEKYVPRSAHRM